MTSESTEDVINTCNPVNYECDPNDPFSDRLCQIVCDPDGTQGYCLEYSSIESAWCAAHPDKFYRAIPFMYCDINGNPTWDTHCEPGWLP
ncbi:MAG TPA: hypothetical protein VF516_30550 [Kofleriaceae bacterium]